MIKKSYYTHTQYKNQYKNQQYDLHTNQYKNTKINNIHLVQMFSTVVRQQLKKAIVTQQQRTFFKGLVKDKHVPVKRGLVVERGNNPAYNVGIKPTSYIGDAIDFVLNHKSLKLFIARSGFIALSFFAALYSIPRPFVDFVFDESLQTHQRYEERLKARYTQPPPFVRNDV